MFDNSHVYNTLHEIAQAVGVNTKKVSFLLNEGIIPSSTKGENKHRRYYTNDVFIEFAARRLSLALNEEPSGMKVFSHKNISKEVLNGLNRGGCEVVTIINQKGGVGKTTTTVNLATALSKLGQRVLILDMDNQSQSTFYLMDEEYNNKSILNIFKKYADEQSIEKKDVSPFIVSSKKDFFGNSVDLIPSEIRLARTLEFMRMLTSPEKILDKIIATVREDYDFIIIDTPPSANLSLSMSVYAADKALLVTKADKFSVTPLKATIEEIDILNRNVDKHIQIDGIIVNNFRQGETLQQKFMDDIIEIHIERLDLPSSQLLVVKYAGSLMDSVQNDGIAAIEYKKYPKEGIRVSVPFYEYAISLIERKK